MPQTINQAEPVPSPSSISSFSNSSSAMEPGLDEFSYRPIPPLAVVSVLLSVCALSGLLSPLGLVFALFGLVLGIVSKKQIRKAAGDLSGGWIAQLGFFSSALLLFGGAGLHVYWYQTEVPAGYQRLSFNMDISKKQFVVEDYQQKAHPDVAKLDGQQIFLKGYMYPEGRADGIDSFILCRDNGQCCFGGQPKLYDMIAVKMERGLTARYSDSMVSVAGVFRLRDMSQAGNLNPAYEIEATHFSQAKTAF